MEAYVEISDPDYDESVFKTADLEELFIVSKVVVKLAPKIEPVTIKVTRAEDHGMKKCLRCWKYWEHLGHDPNHPDLCDRCTKVMIDLFPSS